MKTAISLFLLVGIWVASPSHAQDGQSPDPWQAADRLDRFGELVARPGWRIESGFLTREAIPENWRTRLGVLREPARGLGFAGRWDREWFAGVDPVDDLSFRLVARTDPVRMSLGVGAVHWTNNSLVRVQGSVDTALGRSLVVGVRGAVHPARPSLDPQFIFRVHTVLGPWMAGGELGSAPGDWRLTLGVWLGSRVTWLVSYSGSRPMVGLGWRLWGGEVRVEETRHPWLGSIVRVAWFMGGVG